MYIETWPKITLLVPKDNMIKRHMEIYADTLFARPGSMQKTVGYLCITNTKHRITCTCLPVTVGHGHG